MIELAGTRYAVGARTAAGAAIATTFGIAAYSSYLLEACLMASGPRAPQTLALVDTAMQFFYLIFFLAGWMTLVTLMGTDKQTVEEFGPPPSRRFPRWWQQWRRSELAAFLNAQGYLMFGVVGALAAQHHWIGVDNQWRAFTTLGVAALMIGHGVSMVRLSRRMRHEATTVVDGAIDECRGFDWDRLDVNDDQRFRQRFHDKRWKTPTAIKHPAEADRYARLARIRRGTLMVVGALTGLFAVSLANAPLSQFVTTTARVFAHPTQPAGQPGLGQVVPLGACLVLFVVPVLLQYRVGDLDALSKIYDDRATELRDAIEHRTRAAQRRFSDCGQFHRRMTGVRSARTSRPTRVQRAQLRHLLAQQL